MVTVARLPCMTPASTQRDSAFTVHGCCVFVNSCAAAACASASASPSAQRQHLEQAADAAVRPHQARSSRDALVARVRHHHGAQSAARSGALDWTFVTVSRSPCSCKLMYDASMQLEASRPAYRSRGATSVRDTAPAMPPATSRSYICCGGARFSLRTMQTCTAAVARPATACSQP